MKISYRVLVTLTFAFLSVFANCTETFAFDCYDDSESGFYQVMEIHGWENGITQIMTTINPSCYEPFLIRHRDVTEPILRKIVLDPDKHPVLRVRRAIYFSSKFGFDNLLDEYFKLTHHPEAAIRNESIRAFAPICEPDQFSELLGMMVPGEPDLNKSILTTIRERKIFDPQLLIKWRKDEIEKDKNREKKLMGDWLLKEVDRTIAVLKEAQR